MVPMVVGDTEKASGKRPTEVASSAVTPASVGQLHEPIRDHVLKKLDLTWLRTRSITPPLADCDDDSFSSAAVSAGLRDLQSPMLPDDNCWRTSSPR